MADKPLIGTFCWNELMTRDAAKARAFYGALFGWSMSDMPMPEGNYTILKAGTTDVGGLMQIRSDMGAMPSHWMAYVLVANVDAATQRAGELGATVHVAGMDIPGIGRFGLFEDPTGAMLSVFQPLQAPAARKPAPRTTAKRPAKRAAARAVKTGAKRRARRR